MVKNKVTDDKVSKLRRKAEKKLQIRQENNKTAQDLSKREQGHLVHELQVHQIELEVQNEELQKTQLYLEAARDRYIDLFDFAPVGYMTVSEKGLILEANLTLTVMLGVERSLLIRQPFSHFIDKDFQDVYYLHRKKLFETKLKQTCELTLNKKDNTQFYARLECMLVEDVYGETTPQVRAAITDVSKEKLAEEALKQSQELQRNYLQQRLEALWDISKIFDSTWSVICERILLEALKITQSKYAFFGFLSKDERVLTLYSWSSQAFVDCQTQDKPLEYAIENAGIWAEAVRKRRPIIINDYGAVHPAKKGCPGGHVPLTRILSVPVFRKEHIVSLAVVANKSVEYTLEDIQQIQNFLNNVQVVLEQKKSEYARQSAEKELEKQRVLSLRMDRLLSLGEMAAGMAHELNQPLSGVRGISEHLLIALERKWHFSEEKSRAKLKLIMEQADRMTHIIDHVRMFAREAGKAEVKPVNVNNVIASSIKMLGEQFRAHGLALKSELDVELPLVLANPFSLEEVMLNLLSNARDSVEERLNIDSDASCEILLRTSIAPEFSKQPVRIQVIDRGIGISDELMENLFDPFFTTKDPDKGTGLGLSICRSIVEQFNGSIFIKSEPGKGSTVTINLPVMSKTNP
jgi:PAS domain S-box-containing protein